jgi:hypothetical protein
MDRNILAMFCTVATDKDMVGNAERALCKISKDDLVLERD